MAALQAMLRVSKRDVEVRLHEVRAATLVVMGSKDPDFGDPAEEAETVAKLLRGRPTMIEGAGHYPHAEFPDETARAVVGFLRATGAR
jgi:pimeloyl-ACP methyl ester carboxylesterase